MSKEKSDIKTPKNAKYRKIMLVRNSKGSESRSDYFYDEHNNLIRLVNTSLLEENPDIADIAVIDISYKYNGDGTIAEKTTVGGNPFGTVKTQKFIYGKNKKVCIEHKFENNRPAGGFSYEYDSHGNLIKKLFLYDGKIVATACEYEYIYDESGRISCKKETVNVDENYICCQIWYEYDGNGNIAYEKSLKCDADFPECHKYFYDEDNRLIKNENYMDNKLLSTVVHQYEFY